MQASCMPSGRRRSRAALGPCRLILDQHVPESEQSRAAWSLIQMEVRGSLNSARVATPLANKLIHAAGRHNAGTQAL